MNRTDRLYALVEELRARSPRLMRATELAARFEVSTRTIERDLLALQEAGVPIRTQPGPGGGYGLDRDATLPPLNLSADEVAALATALAAAGPTPFAEAGRRALAKLVGAMGAAPKEAANTLVGRTRVARPPARPTGPVAATLGRALLDAVAVEIAYRDAEGDESVRVVEPAGLFATPHGWYLAAWCRLRRGARAFRLDRIARAVPTGESIVPRPLEALLADLPYDLAEPPLT